MRMIGLARIEIKEVTRSTGLRRIYLSRPHAYSAIVSLSYAIRI